MKNSTKLLTLAASFLAFSSASFAQLLTTVSTEADFSGSLLTFGAFNVAGSTRTQTFTNVSAVKSLTYDFFTTATASSVTARTFTATFGEWNGSALVGGTTFSIPNFTVPDATTWSTQTVGGFTGLTYQVTVDFSSALNDPKIWNPTYGYVTDSTKTYAMVIHNTGAATQMGLGFTDIDSYANGTATFNPGVDYVFSQITTVPGNQTLVPVPESSTVAAIAGSVLVAGLVTFRLRQRRQLALAPALAA